MAKLDGVKVIDMTAGKIEKVAYEGAEYERAEHPIKKDDLILNVDDHEIDLTIGAFYKVISVDNFNDVQFLDDVDDGRDRHEDDIDFVPFRKVAVQDPTLEARVGKLESDVAALKGEQESHGFKKGDKAILKTVQGALLGFKAGEIVTITNEKNVGGSEFEVYNGRTHGFTNADNLTPIEEKPLAVGDYAKVVSVEATEESRGMPSVKVGQIVYLSGESDTRSSEGFKVQTVDHKEIGCDNVVVDDLVRVTDEEVAEAKAAMKPKLTVGDYAKVVGRTYLGDIKTGAVVKITKEADDDGDYKIELLDESDHDFAQASSLEKIDADKAAIIDKWAKIGRGVNEYKEGDVVRVLDVKKSFAFDLSGGEINVITKFCDNDSFQVGSGSGWVGATQVELVAPVESRVDR